MKKIVEMNKAAWEEAFERRTTGFGDDHAQRLGREPWAFLEPPVVEALKQADLRGACIAQFCCNNGRELTSAVKNTGAREGVGFDIAGNILAQARQIANEANVPCTFVEGDVCEVPAAYDGRFDLILVTVGALCWMERLQPFFERAAACLKTGGRLLIHEAHPVAGMFAVPQEAAFDAAEPTRLCYSYFKTEPFVDTYGMVYLAGTTYDSKPFTCFVHTMGSIVTAVAESGLRIARLREYDTDLSGDTEALSGKGVPLSYLLLAEKP